MWPIVVIKILVLLHFVVLVIALMGAVVTWFGFFKERKKLLRIYFWTIALVAVSYVTTGACVLTTLERYLRREYWPQTVYPEGFIAHHFKYIGVTIADTMSFWIMVTLLTVGILGLLYHHTNIRRVFNR